MTWFGTSGSRYYMAPGELLHPDPYGGDPQGFRFVVYAWYADWFWFDDCYFLDRRTGDQARPEDVAGLEAHIDDYIAQQEDPDNWWAVAFDHETGKVYETFSRTWWELPINPLTGQPFDFGCYSVPALKTVGEGKKKGGRRPS